MLRTIRNGPPSITRLAPFTRWSISFNIIRNKHTSEYNKENDYGIDELPLHLVKPYKQKAPVILHNIIYKDKIKTPGDQHAMVFIPGFLDSVSCWASVGRTISHRNRRRAVAMDLRNHGCSPRRGPVDLATMADDVIFTIENSAKLRKVSLIGHSLGGKVAMMVAIKRPDLIQKLIVIDAAPSEADVEQQDKSVRRFLIALCHLEVMLGNLFNKKQKEYKPVYDKAKQILRQFNISEYQEHMALNSIILRKKFRIRSPVLQFLKFDFMKEIGKWPVEYFEGNKFTGPTLIMKAAKSRFITQNDLDNEFPKYFTNYKLENFDCGHVIFAEEPTKFIKSVLDFLQKNSAGEDLSQVHIRRIVDDKITAHISEFADNVEDDIEYNGEDEVGEPVEFSENPSQPQEEPAQTSVS